MSHPHQVKLNPSTYHHPRYKQLGVMERWCERHAPGRWGHPLHVEEWMREGEVQQLKRPVYDTFLFADKPVAALFKLTFWKPQ